jgi:hypothetical protein
MTSRIKQVALTIGLTVPLAVSAITSGPWSVAPSAQPNTSQHMLGPNNPILIDVNGNGPGAGDANANLQQFGSTLQLPTQWDCGLNEGNTLAGLGNMDQAGHFTTITRQNGLHTQSIGISNCAGGVATNFVYTELDFQGIKGTGTGAFVDSNGDGQADSFSVTGKVNAMVNLVFTPDSQYVSIPLSQQALLGGATAKCGISPVPQIWVPLADTNGDGRGDSVVFDLNGDGVADSQFCRSPRIAGVGVPATNNVALAILTMLLGSLGVWAIGRRRPLVPPARPV